MRWPKQAYWLLFATTMAVYLTMVLSSLPFIGGGFDYLENVRVAKMLQRPPEAVEAQLIANASLATTRKSGLITASMIALLVGIGWVFARRVRGTG